MALQKSITAKNNFGGDSVLSDCYIKITRVVGDKNGISLTVGYFSDSSELSLYKTEVFGFVPSVSEGSENFIKQGYVYLKSLSEFTDAIDV